MNRPLDVPFVNADASLSAYQQLRNTFSATEPPTWALLLAESCRARGFGVGLLDCAAERLSPEQAVRREDSKGTFEEVNIRDVAASIRPPTSNDIANSIFGFPDETLDTMQQTLDLALELNTEMANMYPCQALPGLPLHAEVRRAGWPLPKDLAGYGFLSYESQPLPTKHVSAAEVLRFRDRAWQTSFTNPAWLDLVERRFGAQQRRDVEEMARIPLRRRLLGD